MAVMKGAMIGGSLLPENQFKDVIKQLFLDSENIKTLNNIIDRALRNISSKNIRAAYKNIEEFETRLLKNPPTSIMVITNLKSEEGNYKWAWNKDEKNAIRKSGKISYSKTVKNNLINEELSNIFSKHLLDLIATVNSTELTNEEIDTLFNHYVYQNKDTKRIEGLRARNDRNLKNIIYGDNPQYIGQIADAFLNHLGNMHKSLLINTTIDNIKPIPYSVMTEEGENFYQLLIDSTNSTPWYTGGDLILLGENSEVIANIQLKTILNEKSSSVGKISYTTLQKNLLELKELIKTENIIDADQFADRMYNMFATSGIIDEVNDKIINTAVNQVKKNLNLII